MTAIAENPTPAAIEAAVNVTTAVVDPATLTVAANARKDFTIDADFLASVKELGVLQPIVVEATETGYHVLYGQRRTLAAIEAGLTGVPIFISDAQTEADRLAKQLAENDHRAAMTDADRAETYHQLSLLGMSAAAIAKRTSKPKADIAVALKAKSDTTSAEALGKGLSLTQSVTLIEFADDAELVAELEAKAIKNPGGFDYAVQQERDKRTRAATLAAARAELDPKLTIVDEDPSGHWYTGPNAAIADLTKADGTIVPMDYADAAYVGLSYNDKPYVRYVVTDWKGRGLRKQGKGGGMTDAEKAERKELIANNRDMDSAIVVRKTWVTELLACKTAPKGSLAFIASSFADHNYIAANGINNKLDLAGEFLGGKEGDRSHYAKVAARPAKAETAILAAVLAGFEGDMDRQSWRRPSKTHQHYLNQLVRWGYQPSIVEKIIIDK